MSSLLSKREHCALEILKAMISNPELSKGFIKPVKGEEGDFYYYDIVFHIVFEMADEFLELSE